jgi:hypothetical protein
VTDLRPSPYRGLRPYTEAEAAFFFGREAEGETIAANLLSARLTLLYGPSGVGKSSVLLAAVVNSLRKRSRANLAEEDTAGFAVIVVRAWGDPDPLKAIAAAAYAEAAALLERDDLPDPPDGATLAEVLDHWSVQVRGKLLVLFDQFEEYFLYHDHESGPGTFDAEFPQAVNHAKLRANFLLSIRDDALARLDRFKGRIPNLFDNRLQIDHLTLAAARDAVEEPIEVFNQGVPPEQRIEIEDKLVHDVLDQVRTGRVSLESVGAGAVGDSAAAEARVETPILQVVLTALWEKEAEKGSQTLRAQTLVELGGAQQVVRDRLDERMKRLDPGEQAIAADVARFLVTPSGTKIAYTATDLAAMSFPKPDLADWAYPQVESVLEKLAEGDTRILRPVAPLGGKGPTRYEIFHDVLGPAILDWRLRYLKDRELSDAVRVGVAGGVLVVSGFWWLFWTLIVVYAAISDNSYAWLFLIWTLSALAVLLGWTRVLRLRWLRRQPHLLLATLIAAVAVFTYPFSLLVIVPIGLLRRRRRQRRRRAVRVANGEGNGISVGASRVGDALGE